MVGKVSSFNPSSSIVKAFAFCWFQELDLSLVFGLFYMELTTLQGKPCTLSCRTFLFMKLKKNLSFCTMVSLHGYFPTVQCG